MDNWQQLTKILSIIKRNESRGNRKITLNLLPDSIVNRLSKMGYNVEMKELRKQQFHIISWKKIHLDFIIEESTSSYDECADENQPFSWEKNLKKKLDVYPKFDSAELALIKIISDLSEFINFSDLDD